MGYDVHIARTAFWFDSEEEAIPLEEWLTVVQSDPDRALDPENRPPDALFVGHPESPAPLWWQRGMIDTKNPDTATILKMLEIASRLGAKVQGDDLETYTLAKDGSSRLERHW